MKRFILFLLILYAMKNTIKILLLIPALWLTALSCQQAAEKAAENALEKALENESGGKADVDVDKNEINIESDEGNVRIGTNENTWPAGMPAAVSQPRGGEITGVVTAKTDQGNTWMVQYTGISIDELEHYREVLESKGFNTTVMKDKDGGMVSGDKGSLKVVLSLGNEGGGLMVMEGYK